MIRQSLSALCCALSVIFLVACGGGGGGDAASTAQAIPPIPTPIVVPTSTVTVVVQGNIKYERVGNLASGALDYSSISAQPVRGATVELLSGGTVVASTQSSATGQYAFTSAPGSVTLSIRVRAELKQTTGLAQWNVSVSDNTNGNAMYVLASANFNSGTGAIQNLTAGSGWGGTSYTGVRAAGPFALIDVFYQSQQKVLASHPNTIFPPLRAFWSINNSTAAGDVTLGNLGTSFFREITSGTGSTRELYILGRQNDDTDEYDGSVVAHEWGHYFQSAFSRDDSTGGRHGGGDDRLDRRIAFSEGWGNAWSGIALAQSRYSDSFGLNQASGFALPLNSGYAGAGPKGWFREQSIQFVLWDLHRQVGFTPIFSALTNPTFNTGTALSDIHSFSSVFRSVASASSTAALDALLSAESVSTTSDFLGNNETNNGGASVALPYYRSITSLGAPVTLAGAQTLCVTSAFDTQNSANKLGRFVYAVFSTPAGGVKTITVSSTNAAVDADFEVYSAGQRVLLADIGITATESASVDLSARQHVLVVYDYNNVIGNPCFSVSIQ